jgi:hypothetical protein
MISVLLIFTGALLSYSVIDGLIHDSITTATRGGGATKLKKDRPPPH